MRYVIDAIYLSLLIAFLPWLVWKALWRKKYRHGLAVRFLGWAPLRQGEKFCTWLHAVSVGEVNLLVPIVAEIARTHPNWQCVISTTTQTGYELARKRFAGHVVFYFPLDFSWAVHCAMRRIRPNLLVLAELELWPNLIRAARRQGARVAVINGRLSERSFRGYRRLAWVLRPVLRQIDLVLAQNETYAERFRALGAPQVIVTGSVKFDGAQTDRRNSQTQQLRQLAAIADTDIVFLTGSTQEPEERLAVEAFESLAPRFPDLRLIVVPRHAERFDEVARMLNQSGLHWQRRSQCPPLADHTPCDGPPQVDPNPCRILLVDTIGELGAWWGAAQIAFVGGSMGTRGGQNMIEPAAYGAAVSFGSNTRNFHDIVSALLEAQAAVVVKDGAELTAFVRQCLENPAFAEELGRRAKSLVLSQQGATRRSLELLTQLEGSADSDAINPRHSLPRPHARQQKHSTQSGSRPA